MREPTEIVIMQYGQAACDVADVVGGERGDTGLTDEGVEQVALRALAMNAQARQERPYAFVYNGSRLRQQQTAKIVAAILRVPKPRGDQALACQRHARAVDGHPWTQVRELLGRAPAAVPDTSTGREGESWSRYVDRVEAALRRLTALHTGQRIVVIGDAGHVEASRRIFGPGCERAGGLADGAGLEPAGLTCWREQPVAGLDAGTAASFALATADCHMGSEVSGR